MKWEARLCFTYMRPGFAVGSNIVHAAEFFNNGLFAKTELHCDRIIKQSTEMCWTVKVELKWSETLLKINLSHTFLQLQSKGCFLLLVIHKLEHQYIFFKCLFCFFLVSLVWLCRSKKKRIINVLMTFWHTVCLF